MRLPGRITQEQHALMRHWAEWRASDAPYIGMGHRQTNMLHRDAAAGGGRPNIRSTSETAEVIDIRLRQLREAGDIEAHAMAALYYGADAPLGRCAQELGIAYHTASNLFHRAVSFATSPIVERYGGPQAVDELRNSC